MTATPKVIAFYAVNVEPDHARFAQDAIKFFASHAEEGHYTFVPTTNWDDLNDTNLESCAVVVWLNDEPHTPQQEQAFQRYMTHGGAWLGFHAVGYTEKKTNWPWYQSFLGGIFDGNTPRPHQFQDRSLVAVFNRSREDGGNRPLATRAGEVGEATEVPDAVIDRRIGDDRSLASNLAY